MVAPLPSLEGAVEEMLRVLAQRNFRPRSERSPARKIITVDGRPMTSKRRPQRPRGSDIAFAGTEGESVQP